MDDLLAGLRHLLPAYPCEDDAVTAIAPNEAMHRMSGTHICPRFGWLWVPLIGDLDR